MISRIILILFLSFNFLKAQEVVASNKIELPDFSATEHISIIDSNNNIHVLFKVLNSLSHITYNSSFELIKEKEYEEDELSNKKIIGYRLGTENVIELYLAVNHRKKFTSLTIEDDTISVTEFDFKLKGERFIKSINHNNKFHFLTVSKNSSTLHRYTFSKDNFIRVSYDFNNELFFDWENRRTNLSAILNRQRIETIEPEIPTTIDITSAKIKIYTYPEKLLLTLNLRKDLTEIMTLSLNDGYSEFSSFNSPKLKGEQQIITNSNSFVYHNKLLQISTNSNAMAFEIVSLDNSHSLQSYSIEGNDEIPFKNSPIYQEGTLFSTGKEKEMNNTKKFLRKITNSELGIVAFKKDDLVHIHLGAIKATQGGAGDIVAMGILFGAIGAVAYAALMTQTHAFSSYENTKAFYIQSVFDPVSYEHIQEIPAKNTFDEIKEYNKGKRLNNMLFKTVFRYDDHFIYAYYDRKNREYNLVKFQ